MPVKRVHGKTGFKGESRINMENTTGIFSLIYTIGEILTMTWPGRIVLGMAVGSMLARLARA